MFVKNPEYFLTIAKERSISKAESHAICVSRHNLAHAVSISRFVILLTLLVPQNEPIIPHLHACAQYVMLSV